MLTDSGHLRMQSAMRSRQISISKRLGQDEVDDADAVDTSTRKAGVIHARH